MKTRTRFKLACMTAMAALAVPLPALATDYVGPDGGFWSVPGNWSPAFVPPNGDIANIGGSTDRSVILNTSYSPPGLVALNVDGSLPFVTATVVHSSAVTMQVSSEVEIGIRNRGRYNQTSGTHNANSLVVGTFAGSFGQYDLSFGSVTAGQLLIGYGGTGIFTQNSGTVTVNGGSFLVGGSFTNLGTGNGAYNLIGGTVNANSVQVGGDGNGSFQQQGGTATFSGGLFNESHGNINLSNGTLNAPLTNNGGFVQSGGRFNGGVLNYGALTLSGGILTITNSGAVGGMLNAGNFGLYGGTLVLNGNATNQGSMYFQGGVNIYGSNGLNNQGTITLASGFINLNGAASSNSGNMLLSPGTSLNLNVNNFTNNGTLNLNGGRVGGVASLINRFGATIRGTGVIATGFDNQGGSILLDSGTTLIVNNFNSSGIIQLTNDAASLTGGTITNSGEVLGHGSIANQISNIGGGMIEANGGTLILGGTATNGSGGVLSAPAGGKLFFPGGLNTNSGLINLTGGYFDNNLSPINNTGQMSGFGTIRTGGLVNNGSVTLTGGFTTVNGGVVNSPTRQIKIAHDPALFTGAVTNNGVFKTTSTTVTFSGAYTENGTFISDPSDNYFIDVFLNAPGSWTGGVGDRFFVKGVLDWSGGSMNGAGAQTFNQGSATLHDANVKTLNGFTFNNEKPLTISGGNIDMGNGALINNTNTFDFQSDAGISNTLGGAATFANAATLRKSGGAGTSNIAALLTNNNGNIDVQSGTLSLNGGLNIAAITTLQKTGGGALRVGGPQNHGAGANLNILAGNVRMASNAGVAATGANAAVHNLNVNVSGNNTALILEFSTDVGNLTVPFANTGNQSLDLNTPAAAGAFNAIRIYASDLAAAKTTLWSAIKNANAPGSLTPNDGIYDSGKAAHAGTGIGLARIADAHGDQHIQIRLARIGDLNLDGTVTISDFIDLAAHFNSSDPSITWQEGDLNYDGSVTISDFIDLAANFNSAYAGDRETLSEFASSIGVDPAVIGSAVPEPGAALGIGAAALLLGSRRRKLAH